MKRTEKLGNILKKTEILVIIISEKTENVVGKIISLVVLLNLEESEKCSCKM